METDFKRGEFPQLVVHLLGRQLRSGHEQTPSRDLVGQDLPTFGDVGGERASDRTRNQFTSGFSIGYVLLKTQSFIDVRLAKHALRDEIIAQPDISGFRGEG